MSLCPITCETRGYSLIFRVIVGLEIIYLKLLAQCWHIMDTMGTVLDVKRSFHLVEM